MKPISLEMAAFGPYDKVVCIDFKKISEQGLFLITGPTGSGKTSIFDAIVFALYGEASGNFRDPKQLRCDFASEKQETYVDLLFEFRNEIYHIRRNPQYQKKGRKTPISSQALLEMPGNKSISGTKAVDKKISELLGIDVLQFKKIAMIAQGEFTKLIYASSDEKEKIFRKLFDTHKYEMFELKIKEKYTSLKKKMENYEIQISTLKKQLYLKSDKVIMSEYLMDIKHLLQNLEDEVKAIEIKRNHFNEQLLITNKRYIVEKETNKKIERLNIVKNKIDLLDQKKAYFQQINQRIIFANHARTCNVLDIQYHNYQQLIVNVNQNNKENDLLIQSLEENMNTLYPKYNEITMIKQKIQERYVTIEKLKEQSRKIENQNKILNDLTKYKQTLDHLLNHKEEIDQQMKRCLEHIEQIENDLVLNQQLPKQMLDVQEMIMKLHQDILTSQHIEKLHQEISYHQQLIDCLVKEYQNKEQQFIQCSNEYLQYESMYLQSQAGILAKDLKEGIACPVCGSHHHPLLATMNDQMLSEEDLKEKKTSLDLLKKEKEDLYFKLNQENQQLEFKNESIKAEEKRLIFFQDLKDLNTQYDQHTKQLDKLTILKAQLDTKQQKLMEYKDQMKVLNIQFEQVSTKIGQTENNIANLQGQLDQNYCNESLEETIQKMNDLVQLNKNQEDQIENIVSSYQKLLSDLDKSRGKSNSYHQQLLQLKKDSQEVYQQFTDLVNQHFSSIENYKLALEDVQKIEELQTLLQHYQLELHQYTNEHEQLSKELLRFELMDLRSLQNDIEQLQIDYQCQDDKYQEKLSLWKNQKNIIQQMDQIHHSINDISLLYEQIYDLYSVTSGNNELKLSFERYILAMYFEQIIELSNIRFYEMSNHRYKMLRKKERGQRQSGLDLEVQDFESGTIRDIKTLSGGEAFKAALCLALGLSDMIQNYVGGIELNILFIDEGFGSLDYQSLQSAMQVLLQLKENNKMIGIISHVQELKNQIDNQIVITKQNVGSKVNVNI